MASSMQRQAGFTLLEIIIVAFFLALIAGTVVVNISPAPRDSDARTAAVVFKERLEHARQMALIRNWVIGVDVGEQHYAFYRWAERRWQPVNQPGLNAQHFEWLRAELTLGDLAILDNITDGDRNAVFQSDDDGRGDSNRDDTENIAPRLLVFESSDFVPFSLAIRDPFSGETYWIDGRDGLHLHVGDEPL